MLNLLLKIRRCCFLYYQRAKGQEYASRKHKESFAALLIPYYVTPFSTLAVLYHKYSFAVFPLFKNFTGKIMVAVLLFLPYHVFINLFFKSAQKT